MFFMILLFNKFNVPKTSIMTKNAFLKQLILIVLAVNLDTTTQKQTGIDGGYNVQMLYVALVRTQMRVVWLVF
jgi:hypothetical protein